MKKSTLPPALLLPLTAALGSYALGLGVLHYLGKHIHAGVALQGLLWVWLILGATYTLTLAFEKKTPADRQRLLLAAFALLAAAAVITTWLHWQKALNLPAALIQLALVLLGVAYSTPPMRWRYGGYGEAVHAAAITLFPPALAYLLQQNSLHRFVGMLSLPLFFTYFAALLAWEFPNYLADLKAERRTILTRLDWRLTMRLHNLALLIAFLLLALDVPLGVPWELVAPCGITFVAAALQVWAFERIAAGAHPLWKWIRLNAALIYGLTTYLLVFTLWKV